MQACLTWQGTTQVYHYFPSDTGRGQPPIDTAVDLCCGCMDKAQTDPGVLERALTTLLRATAEQPPRKKQRGAAEKQRLPSCEISRDARRERLFFCTCCFFTKRDPYSCGFSDTKRNQPKDGLRHHVKTVCKQCPEETLFTVELFSKDGKRYVGLCVCGQERCLGANEDWTQQPEADQWQLAMEARFDADHRGADHFLGKPPPPHERIV